MAGEHTNVTVHVEPPVEVVEEERPPSHTGDPDEILQIEPTDTVAPDVQIPIVPQVEVDRADPIVEEAV